MCFFLCENLTPYKFALKSFSKNLAIQKSDKGNYQKTRLSRKNESISDSSKCSQVLVTDDKQMNFIVKVERHIKNFLKDLKFEVISGSVIKNLKPRGSRFEIFYGLSKVQKQLGDNWPSFTPIMSTVKTPSYNLAKFLVLLPKLMRSNTFIVKISFEFAKEVTYKT